MVGGALLVLGGEGGEGGCDISVFGERGGTGGGVGAFLIPFIKYFQFFSSRARCAQNFNEQYQSPIGTMIAMFCNRVFLLE